MSDIGTQVLKARIRQDGDTTHVDCPFSHDDGWSRVTVGWEDGAIREGVGAWIARDSTQMGAVGISETSQLHALADLERSNGAFVAVLLQREADLHKAIYNSEDEIVKELRDAEADLYTVQQYITTHVEPGDNNWDAGLKPLWRAERALQAFAARISTKGKSNE